MNKKIKKAEKEIDFKEIKESCETKKKLLKSKKIVKK